MWWVVSGDGDARPISAEERLPRKNGIEVQVRPSFFPGTSTGERNV
jgi:hypothetical protein